MAVRLNASDNNSWLYRSSWPSVSGSVAYTVCCWAQYNGSWTAADDWYAICAMDDGGSHWCNLQFLTDHLGAEYIEYTYQAGSGAAAGRAAPGGGLQTNTWYFVAGVKNTTSNLAYMGFTDSVLDTSLDYFSGDQVPDETNTFSPNKFRVGASGWSGEEFNGRIAYLRVWQGAALSSTDLALEMRSHRARTNLGSLYLDCPFDSNLNDVSGNNNHWSLNTGGSISYVDSPFLGAAVSDVVAVSDGRTTEFSGGETPLSVFVGTIFNRVPF